MNGIEKITARINADMDQEIAQLKAQTQQQCDAILSDSQAQAQRLSEDILAKGRKAADERLERLESAAQMEQRKLTLGAKQEVLGEAFALALEKLCSLPDEQYIALLTDLAVKAAPTGTGKLVFSQKDRNRVGKQVVLAANETTGGALTLSEETREIMGGFVLVDGDVEINATFETLVRLQREKLEKNVAKVLFG